MRNVHNVCIYNIEHRNLETRKILDVFLVQVQNFLLPLSLKVLRHKERNTHSFYSGLSICPPPILCGACSAQIRLASASPKVNLSHSVSSSQLNWFFSKSPKSSTHTSTGQPFYLGFLFWHLWMTHPPRVRQHQCSSLHQTNPCAEPKGSQPN